MKDSEVTDLRHDVNLKKQRDFSSWRNWKFAGARPPALSAQLSTSKCHPFDPCRDLNVLTIVVMRGH